MVDVVGAAAIVGHPDIAAFVVGGEAVLKNTHEISLFPPRPPRDIHCATGCQKSSITNQSLLAIYLNFPINNMEFDLHSHRSTKL